MKLLTKSEVNDASFNRIAILSKRETELQAGEKKLKEGFDNLLNEKMELESNQNEFEIKKELQDKEIALKLALIEEKENELKEEKKKLKTNFDNLITNLK